MLDAQARAGVAGAAQVAARLRTLIALLSGAMASGSRNGASGGALAAGDRAHLAPRCLPAALPSMRWSALASDPGLAPLLQSAYGSQAPTVTVARQNTAAGPAARIQFAFPQNPRPRSPAAMASGFFGSSTPVLVATAAGDRLLLATEPGAGDRLRRLAAAAATAAPSNPALGRHWTRAAAARVSCSWICGGWRARWSGHSSAAPQGRMAEGLLSLPGLAQMSLPVWGNHRGGNQLDVELRVPLSTMTNAASALALFGQAPEVGLAPAP